MVSKREEKKKRWLSDLLKVMLEFLFSEYDTNFLREVVTVMLIYLARLYLNAILKYKK